MKVFKITMIITAIIIVTLLIALILLIWTVKGDIFAIGYNKFLIAPSYNKTDAYLKSNFDELSYVAEELTIMDYESISIEYTNLNGMEGYNMGIRSNHIKHEPIPIPDKLVDHIKALYKSGIRYIWCKDEFVDFTLWTASYEERGIRYSLTGTEPFGEHLIESKKLSKDNWYYYVKDYE